MKKLFTILAVALCSTLAMAQTNQYFWAGGQFIMGNPIDQIDSITFGQLVSTDSIMLYLPRTIKVVHDTIIQKEIVHDTVYIHDCDKLAQWNGFIIESLEDSSIIEYSTKELNNAFDCSGIPGTLWYSYDAENWITWTCSSQITLNKGEKIAVKGNRDSYHKSNTGYYYLSVTKGSCKEYGYISSLFENSDNYSKKSFKDCSLMYFFQGRGFVSLSIPEGVEELGTRTTFSYCFARNDNKIGDVDYGITEIHLPSSLKLIGGTCFEGAKITELTIPRSVTYIGDAVFHCCTKLSTVNYLGTIKEWNAITKGDYRWTSSASIPAKVVHCTDGDATF